MKLTVVKCGQREKIEFLNEVNEERKVQENYEEGKVMLQVTFDGSDPIWPLFLVDKVQACFFKFGMKIIL